MSKVSSRTLFWIEDKRLCYIPSQLSIIYLGLPEVVQKTGLNISVQNFLEVFIHFHTQSVLRPLMPSMEAFIIYPHLFIQTFLFICYDSMFL